MDVTGTIKGISFDMEGNATLSLHINEKQALISEYDSLKDKEKLSISIKPFRKKRSKDANAMLWACLSDMSEVLRTDKWDVYLLMLKRYGQFEYITIPAEAVDRFILTWRTAEVIGEDPNGDTQLICYYGSSTYGTREFSILLDGVISEMKDLGIPVPLSKDIERSLDLWGQKLAKEHSPNVKR